MSVESLLAFNAVLAAALLSPGAAMLFVTKTTVASGRVSGLFAGLGLGTMAALWTLCALLGLGSLFALFPWMYAGLKLGGALYLIWLAIQTWRHANAPLGEGTAPHSRAFLSGLLVNLGNPKSVLFAAAVIVVVFPQGLAAADIAVIVVNHWLLELIFYSGVALALSTRRAQGVYTGFKPLFDRIAATLLGALGLRLLVEKSS